MIIIMKQKQFLILTIIILILNLIWEFSHFRLYNDLTGIPSTTHLIFASFGDVLWIMIIFFVIFLINKNWNWIKKPKTLDYFLIVFFGLIIAVIIEAVNLNLGRWAYKELMPTILGVGLSPLIQLSITAILSLIIFRKINS